MNILKKILDFLLKFTLYEHDKDAFRGDDK